MIKRDSCGVLILVFLSMFSMFLTSNSCAATVESTVYVGGSGPGNYTRIQDAINNVSADGTVYVLPGTYYERLVVTTPVHLIGENKDSTIIDGGNEEYVVTLAAGNSALSGFTIIHSGRTFPKAGVFIKSDENTVSGNILTGNFYGMRLESTQGNMISSNEIVHNLRCGVYFSRASNNTLTGNIVGNHSFNGFGLYEFSNDNLLLENILMKNNFSGINIRDSMNNRVIDNRFVGDRIGLHVPIPWYNTVVQGSVFSENHVDIEEERDPFVLIGAGYTVFLLVVFLVLKKWKT